MIPVFEFRFLICSYLPGVPLSLVVYFLLLGQKVAYDKLYFIISPIVIGLFIDGLRHLIESCCPECRVFWKEFDEKKMKKTVQKYESVFLSYILTESNTFFCMYEFFFNFAISCFLALLVMTVKWQEGYCLYLWITLLIILLSLGLSLVFLKRQKELIKKF